jgi:ketosteroid isomerase-like protein
MSAEDLELVRRSFELFIGGDRDAAWELWSEDCIESGIPVDQELASIFSVRDGELVKGEYFMSIAEAREAAELE